ncbi:cation diffusion facilitator family transporter [Bosea sp. F3-2]|uniref:cation diffusion facilitator family transporter n=1 Tax=Bosea sp. F3-2 TaxID=2599640 RepID=UPI0032BF94F7
MRATIWARVAHPHDWVRHIVALLHGRARIVAVAMSADVAVAGLKFAAAYASGSSAMYAEALHSIMDASTEIALLYGIVAARRPANAVHQLGFGREVYFWSFVAALVIFAAGAGSALHDGATQIASPQPIEALTLNFSILFISLVIELLSTRYALYWILGSRGLSGLGRFIRGSPDTSSLTILFGGLASLAGLFIAAMGIGLGALLDRPLLDGFASIGIALILAATALILAAQGKSLLIGRSVSPATTQAIIGIAAAVSGVESVNGATTVQLSPEQILVALSVTFEGRLSAPEIERATAALDVAVKSKHPEVVSFFVKPQSRKTFAELSAARGW